MRHNKHLFVTPRGKLFANIILFYFFMQCLTFCICANILVIFTVDLFLLMIYNSEIEIIGSIGTFSIMKCFGHTLLLFHLSWYSNYFLHQLFLISINWLVFEIKKMVGWCVFKLQNLVSWYFISHCSTTWWNLLFDLFSSMMYSFNQNNLGNTIFRFVDIFSILRGFCHLSLHFIFETNWVSFSNWLVFCNNTFFQRIDS